MSTQTIHNMDQSEELYALSTIFVAITAYRDTECKHTIHNLFGQAAFPNRVVVGLIWQYADEDADVPFIDDPAYSGKIRVVRYHSTVISFPYIFNESHS